MTHIHPPNALLKVRIHKLWDIVKQAPLMLNKLLALKEHADTAQKSEYIVFQFLLQSRFEGGSGWDRAPREEEEIQGSSLLFDKKNRPQALVPAGRGALLHLHLPCWGICKAADTTPAFGSKYPEFVTVWSSCVSFLRKWIFAGITVWSCGKSL